jgi:hypothetical protein
MSFTSVLSVFGRDVKKVFAWIGSPQAQTLIKEGEAVAEAVYPPLTGIIAIGNTFMTEAVKVEALAAAAGEQNGTGTQKAAAVLNAATPQVLAFAQQYGLPAPTSAQLQQANDAIVAFLNAFPGLATAAPAAPAA